MSWGSSSEVEDDAGEDDFGAVVGGSFGEPCCQATELFEPVEASLDHVAELVEVGVESRWPATRAALGFAAGDLVGAFGNGGLDPALPQRFPGARVGVSLVGQHPPDPYFLSVHLDVPDVIQQRQQLRVVPGLPRREDHRQRQPRGVDGQVKLGRQSASGASEAFAVDGEVFDPVRAAPFFRAPAAC